MQIVDRVILVVDSRPDAIVGLRDRILPERALLRRAQPLTVGAELAAIHPFPFAIAGVTRDGEIPAVPQQFLELVCSWPIPVAWWGESPAGLPPHAQHVARWGELRDAVVSMLASAPGDVRLADHRGLQHGTRQIHSPELEGMVAGYPHAFALGWKVVQPAKAAIARHRLPLRLSRPHAGWVRLEVVET